MELLAGCSKISQSDTPLRDTPISVNVLLPEILTRAGYGSDTPTLFYLSIAQSGTNFDYTNVVMKFDEGAWVRRFPTIFTICHPGGMGVNARSAFLFR